MDMVRAGKLPSMTVPSKFPEYFDPRAARASEDPSRFPAPLPPRLGPGRPRLPWMVHHSWGRISRGEGDAPWQPPTAEERARVEVLMAELREILAEAVRRHGKTLAPLPADRITFRADAEPAVKAVTPSAKSERKAAEARLKAWEAEIEAGGDPLAFDGLRASPELLSRLREDHADGVHG